MHRIRCGLHVENIYSDDLRIGDGDGGELFNGVDGWLETDSGTCWKKWY